MNAGNCTAVRLINQSLRLEVRRYKRNGLHLIMSPIHLVRVDNDSMFKKSTGVSATPVHGHIGEVSLHKNSIKTQINHLRRGQTLTSYMYSVLYIYPT